MDKIRIQLRVNGEERECLAPVHHTLLEVLREDLGLIGTKHGCELGECGTCGACTVVMAGKVVYSCSVLAIDAQGKSIQTIEGLPVSNPVSNAFVNHDAQQCGYCTPGFVMAAKGFLDKHPNPTMEDVKHGLGGNLCRCGTYMGVRQAVLEAAKTMKGAKNG